LVVTAKGGKLWDTEVANKEKLVSEALIIYLKNCGDRNFLELMRLDR